MVETVLLIAISGANAVQYAAFFFYGSVDRETFLPWTFLVIAS